MSIQRPGLEQIDGSGATIGEVPVWNPVTQAWEPGAPPGVQSIVPGTNIAVDNTDPQHPVVSALVPLTTVIGGVPDFVWDADNQLVFTEAP